MEIIYKSNKDAEQRGLGLIDRESNKRERKHKCFNWELSGEVVMDVNIDNWS
jgi:hypothetical protein